jgi:hypothetical protein
MPRGYPRHRSPPNWREVANDPEPLSITADHVAAELERFRRPRMAEFVRSLGKSSQLDNRERARLVARINELQEKYEPAPARVEVNHQPPPEASD